MRSWDIFCHVVDNYGDIGVTWRLARQITAELNEPVRLFVDDLNAFRHLCPQIDVSKAQQEIMDVHVVRWQQDLQTSPADVVIEAFGCPIPEDFVIEMQRREPASIWINLEYLSAESWVEECHLLPSPQNVGPKKYFFFPGFTNSTGGLLRETGLLQQRDHFLAEERQDFLQRLGVYPSPNSRLISLFTYENPQIGSWLDSLTQGSEACHILLPPGRVTKNVEEWLGVAQLRPNERHSRGSLVIQTIPFLSQQDYDRLLWSCDLNIVRGEDSFVRAQWAGKPFIWHIYQQEENTHLVKLNAFLERYLERVDAITAGNIKQLWMDWNTNQPLTQSWLIWQQNSRQIETSAAAWSTELGMQKSLVESLAEFAQNC